MFPDFCHILGAIPDLLFVCLDLGLGGVGGVSAPGGARAIVPLRLQLCDDDSREGREREQSSALLRCFFGAAVDPTRTLWPPVHKLEPPWSGEVHCGLLGYAQRLIRTDGQSV